MSDIEKEWSVAGHKLGCPVCGHGRFWYRTTLMNTRLATFFNLDWANQAAVNFVCGRCGYVMWFIDPPIDRDKPLAKDTDFGYIDPETLKEVQAAVRLTYKLAQKDIAEVKPTPSKDKYLVNTLSGTFVVQLGTPSPMVAEWNQDAEVREWLMRDGS